MILDWEISYPQSKIYKIAVEIEGKKTSLGICTSSGTVGHSLSFGKADAAATKIGNLVKGKEDIEQALEFDKTVYGLKGVIIIKDDLMGVWGDIKLV
ncbi:MAG: hypothetical protein ABIF11_10660 [Nitrospirota bacterium]